jgi:DNA-binding HxlR family transcriptional regulator
LNTLVAIDSLDSKENTKILQAQPESLPSLHTPLIRQEGASRFIKRGESSACFYFQEAKKRIGDKWSLLVLFILKDGSLRFNELLRGVEGISQKVLSCTLRDLERNGYLSRQVMASTPPGVTYSLTAMGKEFLAVLGTLSAWVEQHWPQIEQCRQQFDSHASPVQN